MAMSLRIEEELELVLGLCERDAESRTTWRTALRWEKTIVNKRIT